MLRRIALDNPPLAAAYRKGWEAGRQGAAAAANPYADLRTGRGCVTFSRAFRRRWEDGRRDAAEGKPRMVYPKPHGADDAHRRLTSGTLMGSRGVGRYAYVDADDVLWLDDEGDPENMRLSELVERYRRRR